MHDRAITVGRCEYAANAAGRQISHVMRLLSDRQRQPNRGANAASFVGWENAGRSRKRFPPCILLLPGKNRAAEPPTFKSWTTDRYSIDESVDHRTWPKTKLQLMPPKPKALLMTVCTGRSSL